MKVDKKGFTLVELLVTIIIMAMIMTLAVTSYIKIRNQKKAEMWEEVKAQIETAASEYFTSNEYKYENLDDSFKGKVYLKTLVDADYLEAVTNPITNKLVDSCSVIEVTKKSNSFSSKFTDNIEKGCSDYSNYVSYSYPNGPGGSIEYYKDSSAKNKASLDSSTNWFNINSLGSMAGQPTPLTVCINPDTKNNGSIIDESVLISYNSNNYNIRKVNNKYCTTINEDGLYKDMKFYLENSSGVSWIAYSSINKDTIIPSGKITINSTNSNYNTNNVNAYVDFKDETSKVKSVTLKNKEYTSSSFKASDENYDNKIEALNINLSDNLDGSTIKLPATITDSAGNNNEVQSDNYTVYKLCNEIAYKEGSSWTDVGSRKTCNDTNGTLYITQKRPAVDKYITSQTCPDATNSVAYNAPACDTTPPTVTVEIYERKSNSESCSSNYTGAARFSKTGSGYGNTLGSSEWYNKNGFPYGFTVYYKSTNEDLAKVTSYWNKSGLTISEANSSKYSWVTNDSYPSGGNNTLSATKKGAWGCTYISAEGSRRLNLYFYDAAGNMTKFVATLNMDRTAPTVRLTSGLRKTTCAGANAITSSYTVSDNLSGITYVGDYYGTDSSCDWSNILERHSGSAQSSYSHEHTWGSSSSCTSYGNYNSYNFDSYKLKVRAVDGANNYRGVYFDTDGDMNDSNCED